MSVCGTHRCLAREPVLTLRHTRLTAPPRRSVCQYVGVVLTLWGALALLLSAENAQAMLPQVILAWGCMYVVMALMEQANDNDSKSV